jgi:hypothetical protein
MEAVMDYALSRNGLLVHDRDDWPCAVCRPEGIVGNDDYCLCLDCAHTAMAAAGVGIGEARALLDDLTDALVVLEPQVLPSVLVAN